jgi:hypothetical protein
MDWHVSPTYDTWKTSDPNEDDEYCDEPVVKKHSNRGNRIRYIHCQPSEIKYNDLEKLWKK